MEAPLYPALPALIVDDEPCSLRAIISTLHAGGVTHLVSCQDSRAVLELLAEQEMELALLDLSMPYLSGQALLPQIIERFPNVPVIIVTGANDVETAVECMRIGAFDYMVKPVEGQRMISNVKRAIELRELRAEYTSLKEHMFSKELLSPEAFSEMLTTSPKMEALFRFAETIAATDKPVLVTGQTGVGKELMARAIHRLSGRSGPFVAVNVAGVDDNVFSDTLFGHVRGAFTGADTVRPGLLEHATGGTIFLDEIGDLAGASQVKLLRVIQEREYFPLGADAPKLANARIVLATNRDLDALLGEGRFRADLYYRLQIHRIHIPPLRERPEDLLLLLDHFLGEAARVLGKKKPTPPRELATLLATYSFPGNIRELEAMAFAAVGQHSSGKLSMAPFKALIEKTRLPAASEESNEQETSPFILRPERFPTLKEASAGLVAEAMKRANGNQSIAAELLGITPSALNKRLRYVPSKRQR